MSARNSPFEVIAHRGASARAPENSIPALRMALELGAPAVEIDVQLSRDNVPVLFHDRELRRKTGATGRVRDHGAAFLERLDIGRWFDREHPDASRRFAGTGLATLPQVFASFGRRLRYHIELKSDEARLGQAVIGAVHDAGLFDVTTVTSFRLEQLDAVHRIAPGLPRCWLVRPPGRALPLPAGVTIRMFRSVFERAARSGVDGVAVPAASLTRAVVGEARRLQLGIRAWGVRSDADMMRALRCGADGMTTNWPEQGLALLAGPAGQPQPR